MNIHVVKHLSSIPKAEREKMLRDAPGQRAHFTVTRGRSTSNESRSKAFLVLPKQTKEVSNLQLL